MTLKDIAEAIEAGQRDGLLQTVTGTILTGFSGEKIVGTLQRLVRLSSGDRDACYLEIGVFQGLSLVSVAHANPGTPCLGIDNFSQFDPHGRNLGIVKERIAELSLESAELINMDFEEAFDSMANILRNRRIAVYFVDGPHDYRSQLVCLLRAKPFLARNAVIVVDDSNYPHVRRANRDFLQSHPEFKLLFEAYTDRHPANMPPAGLEVARKTWWNGVNIIVHDPEDSLKELLPSVRDDRDLYFNEHALMSLYMAEYGNDALEAVQDLFRPAPRPARMLRLASRFLRERKGLKGRFARNNTFSDALSPARFAEWREGRPSTLAKSTGPLPGKVERAQ